MRHRSIRAAARAGVAVLVAGVASSLFLVPGAVLPAQAADTPAKTLFVLDSSGSMKEKTSTGEVKIDAAKQALNQVVGQIPSNSPVGLRVFGATVFSRTDAGSCTDSQLEVPVKADNADALRKAIKSYKPYGETPISYALQQSVKDVGSSGKRTIVLVSDGESTCDPDPCEIAGSLTKNTTDLQIDVVGLDVSGKAKDQLKCVASRGKGTYYDASNAETLANSLQTLRNRAGRSFEVSGTPVQGATDPAQAPPITAGGWTDELPPTGDGDVRYYDVYRRTLESTLHVSASINRLGRADAIAMSLTTPEGTACGTAADFRADDFGSSILAAEVSVGKDTPEPAIADCAAATHLIMAVRRADAVEGTARYTGQETVPVELLVTEEKPVATTSGLPAAAKAPKFTPAFGDSPRTAVGGSSFADAPTLKDGYYAANIVPGETQVFLIDQTWGQYVNATLTFTQPSSTLARKIGQGQVKADIKLFSPVRGPATTTLGGGEDFLNGKSRLVLGAAGTPVTYLNRAQAPAKATSFVPGKYAVVVSLGADPQDENYVVPYTLNLDVKGSKAGAPDYAAGTAAPAPPSPSPVPTPGQTQPPTGGMGEDDRLPVGALVGGGVLLLALAGGGAMLLTRRRRAG